MEQSPLTAFGARLRQPAIVVLLTLPFLHTFLRGGIPAADDTLLHLFKLIGLDSALRYGDLWPRYVAAMHYGYGAPVFNYYGLLSLYPPEILHLALGLSFPAAFVAAVIGYAGAAALGAHALGRAIWGERVGVVAAVGYLYTPALFTTFDGLAQFAALALLPWTLWALWRLAQSGGRSEFLIATGLLAALVLTHNITALYAWPLALLFGLAAVWTTPDPDRGRAVLRVLLPFGLAAALTAFFWLPALAEADFVQLARLELPMFDYHNNFLTLRDLFALPTIGDGGRLTYPALSLGWGQLTLGLVGLIAALVVIRQPENRAGRWALLAAAGALGAIFLTTRASVWLWNTLPLVRRLLFPSRLLFPAGLLLSLLAGFGVERVSARLRRPALKSTLLAVCLVGLILYALPTYAVPLEDVPPAATILDLHQFERDTGWLGGTSTGEFLPRWVQKVPHSWGLTDRYAEAEIVPRLAEDSAISVEDAVWGMKRADLTVLAAEPTTAVFEWMYFPGWRAEIDEQPAEIIPTDPNGLIALEIPAGQHHIRLWFGATPIRRMATAVSLVTTGLLAGMVLLARPLWGSISTAESVGQGLLTRMEATALAALGAIIFGVQLLAR